MSCLLGLIILSLIWTSLGHYLAPFLPARTLQIVQDHRNAFIIGYALFVQRGTFMRMITNQNESLSRFSEVTPLRDDYLLENLCSAVSSQYGGSNSANSYYAVKSILESLLKRKLPFADSQKVADRELTIGLLEATDSLGIISKAAQSSRGSPSWAPSWADNTKYILAYSKRTEELNATKMSNLPWNVVINRPTLELPDALIVNGVHLHSITRTYLLQQTRSEYHASEHEVHLKNYWIIHDLVTASNRKAKDGSVAGAKLNYVKYTIRSRLSGFITPELIVLLDSTWLHRNATDLTEEDLVAYTKHFVPGKDDIDMSAILATPAEANPSLTWSEPVWRLFRVHMAVCTVMRGFDLVFFRASIRPDYAGPLWSWIEKDCFGICTSPAMIDDEVVLVEGLPIPFIMRPRGGKYRLVSLAYVFKMMQGQAWEHKDVSGRKPVYVHNRQHRITII